MDVVNALKEAENKLDEYRTMWLKSNSKEIRNMGKAKYYKIFPEVERLRKEFWKMSVKSSL